MTVEASPFAPAPLARPRPQFESPRKGWFLDLAQRYVRWRLGRDVDGVRVRGREALREQLDQTSVIVASNHVAWWDPLVLIALDDGLRAESHALMDSGNHARLGFFGWVGALPLSLDDPSRQVGQLRDAIRSLDGPRRVLWIFPQGRQRPAHRRPLEFLPGVTLLARRAGVPIVPMAINYLFREAPVPAVSVSFEAPIAPTNARAEMLRRLEVAVGEGLDRIDCDREAPSSEFECLVASRWHQDSAGARILARLAAKEARA